LVGTKRAARRVPTFTAAGFVPTLPNPQAVEVLQNNPRDGNAGNNMEMIRFHNLYASTMLNVNVSPSSLE
jgi:hypothetical protein